MALILKTLVDCCPELALRVIELSDIDEIKVLIEVPTLERWISSFQKSIRKEKLRGIRLQAGWAKTQAVIRYNPKPSTKVEGIYLSNVKVAYNDEWDAVHIMRERDNEIQSLLNTSNYLRLAQGVGPITGTSWPRLTPKNNKQLHQILKRALYLVDAIYDHEAHCVVSLRNTVPSYNFEPRDPRPRDQVVGEWDEFLYLTQSARADMQRGIMMWRIPENTRNAQFKFIQKLSMSDLLALWTLCYLATESYHEWRCTAYHNDIDTPHNVGKIRAFKQCILSYGSYFLYGHVRGNGARSRHINSLFQPVIQEFTTDDPLEANRLPPGALAALNSTLMKRLDVAIWELDEAALHQMCQILDVDRECFDNPPSTAGWGAMLG